MISRPAESSPVSGVKPEATTGAVAMPSKPHHSAGNTASRDGARWLAWLTSTRNRKIISVVVGGLTIVGLAVGLGVGLGTQHSSSKSEASNSKPTESPMSTLSVDFSSTYQPTTATSSTSTVSSPSSTPSGACIEGTVATGETQNYLGLCEFTCRYGYCPPGPCACTSYGVGVSPPPETGARGCPLPGESEGYRGLCSFACNHGYCPENACGQNC